MRLNQKAPLLAAVFLTLVPTTLFSSTWYVDGVHGSDNNPCMSPQNACRTIGHAISLAASGDSISVTAATYKENLTIGISLKIFGSNASKTFVDGGGRGRVVTISSASARVTLSELTIQNGSVTGMNPEGGGVSNVGTLTINNSTVNGNSAQAGGALLTLAVAGCQLTTAPSMGTRSHAHLGVFIFACPRGAAFSTPAR